MTTTYGNNTLEKVYENTKKFVKKIGHDELRVYKGGAAPGETEEAAHYLAEMAENMPGSWKFW